jgi:hypothetical protein
MSWFVFTSGCDGQWVNCARVLPKAKALTYIQRVATPRYELHSNPLQPLQHRFPRSIYKDHFGQVEDDLMRRGATQHKALDVLREAPNEAAFESPRDCLIFCVKFHSQHADALRVTRTESAIGRPVNDQGLQ